MKRISDFERLHQENQRLAQALEDEKKRREDLERLIKPTIPLNTNHDNNSKVDPMSAAELHCIMVVDAAIQLRKKEKADEGDSCDLAQLDSDTYVNADSYEFEPLSPPVVPPNTVSPSAYGPFCTSADMVAATNIATSASMIQRARRFESIKIDPKQTGGKTVPRPMQVLPPRVQDTSPTSASLFLQYRAVRVFCVQFLRMWNAKDCIVLPSIIENRSDEELTDEDLLSACVTLDFHASKHFNTHGSMRIEEDLLKTQERNKWRCQIAAAVAIWVSHDKKRSVRQFQQIFAKRLKLSDDGDPRPTSREAAIRAAIRFRKIAQVTPGNIWWYFPLTDNVLSNGKEENWDKAITEYAEMALQDAQYNHDSDSERYLGACNTKPSFK